MTTPTTQLNNSAEGYLTSFSRELGILQVLQEILQKKKQVHTTIFKN